MKNKYLSFAKNGAISIGAMIAAGMGASELTDLFTDNGKVIGAVSTILEYVAGSGAFLPLQARDNKDVYCDEKGRFNYKQFIWDNLKLTASFLPLDVLYITGRPFLQDWFMDKGMTAGNSSIASDSVFIPTYAAAAVGLARLTGVIKPNKKKSLEGEVQK